MCVRPISRPSVPVGRAMPKSATLPCHSPWSDGRGLRLCPLLFSERMGRKKSLAIGAVFPPPLLKREEPNGNGPRRRFAQVSELLELHGQVFHG